jgi:hypothetical protein
VIKGDALMVRAIACLEHVDECKLGVQLAQRDLALAQMLEDDAQDALRSAKESLRSLMGQLTITQQAEVLQAILQRD